MRSSRKIVNKLLSFSILAFLFFFTAVPSALASGGAKEEGKEEKFNAGKMIMHHIADAHEWHFATVGGKHYTLHLPIILYSPDRGIEVFSSKRFHEGAEHGAEHAEAGTYNGYRLTEHDKIVPTDPSRKVYDFSITKNVASMMLSAFIMVIIFLLVARSFKKNSGKAPKGIQSLMEPIILFVRDEIAIPNLGKHKYQKYLPYLLTIFFFIWINNILGLFPGGANASGNIGFTLILAVLTGLIVNISGNASYWKHIFMPPGVPVLLWPILIPVEIIGILTKPFALMIRLFANITAGHIIILSLLSFIFVFKSYLLGVPVGAFMVAMTFLELFVAALQAFIFTMLSALFIGMAVDDHH